MADGTVSYKPQPKIIAAGVVGLLFYVANALGVDIGGLLDNIGDSVGVDVPDSDALATFLAAVIAGYLKKND